MNKTTKLYDRKQKTKPATAKIFLRGGAKLRETRDGKEEGEMARFCLLRCDAVLSCAQSSRMRPPPPKAYIQPAESPSMMYCPLIRPSRNATGLSCLVTGSW